MLLHGGRERLDRRTKWVKGFLAVMIALGLSVRVEVEVLREVIRYRGSWRVVSLGCYLSGIQCEFILNHYYTQKG